MSFNDELRCRASEYAQNHGLILGDEIGFGVHGIVFVTERQSQTPAAPVRSVIKAHRGEADYFRERDVYLRLKRHKVEMIRGCHVPKLLDFDDQYLIIEMTLVTRPFVLDFGGAYLDAPPDFSEEVMADWQTEKVEQFGNRWPEVQAILAVLETYGIYVVDVNPGNIRFVD